MLHFTRQEKIQLVKVYPRILINMHLVTVLFRKKSNQKKKSENFPNSISKSLNGALLNRFWNTQGQSILISFKHLFKTQNYVDAIVAIKTKLKTVKPFVSSYHLLLMIFGNMEIFMPHMLYFPWLSPSISAEIDYWHMF